jgi:hypothetical protein
MSIFHFTRQELKQKQAHDFKEGNVVVCGKYFIWIKYGPYKEYPLRTTVSTKNDFRDLPLHKWPYYIRDFVN